MATKTARSIMRSTDTCLAPDWTLDQVSDHLTKHQISGAPVIDNLGNAIGFVSEYDCLKQLMQSNYYCDNTAMAKDVMSTDLHGVSPDMQLMDVASEINGNRLNVIAVLDEGELVGVISRGDVMRALVQNLDVCAIPEAS